MKTKFLTACCIVGMLAGCSVLPSPKPVPTRYDFGIEQPSRTPPAHLKGRIEVAPLQAPAALSTSAMIYRLAYRNDAIPHRYAQSRWVETPAELLSSLLEARLSAAAADGVALAGMTGDENPVLQVDLLAFDQVFNTPDKSVSRIVVRATFTNARQEVVQKTLTETAPAATADAAGGARAMAVAADRLVNNLIQWMAAHQG